MGHKFEHQQGFSARDPGVWIRGVVVRRGIQVPVHEFIPLDECQELGSRRAIGRAATRQALERFSAETGIVIRPRNGLRMTIACASVALAIASASAIGYMVGATAAPSRARDVAQRSANGLPPEWEDAYWVAWCTSGWCGTDAEQALAFSRAELARSDVAICKAAVMLTEPSVALSGSYRVAAAISMLESFPREVIESAIRRDAPMFEVDAELVLSRLWEAVSK